jgi:hypothetical protein
MNGEIPSAELTMAVRQATGMGVLKAREFAATTDPALLMRILHAGKLPCPDKLVSLPGELRERIFQASADQNSLHLVDPIESDPVFGPVIQRTRDEFEAEVLDEEGGLARGTCHLIWLRTKRRLSEEHGIEWYSPAEMNPGSIFD